MKKLVKGIARALGYEIRPIAPPVSPKVMRLLEAEPALQTEFGAQSQEMLQESRFDAAPLDYVESAPQRWIVEGWRFIAHSYAIVNQWQLLELSRRRNWSLKVVDVPFYRPQWQAQNELFEPAAEKRLRTLEVGDPEEVADTTLRVFFPYDFAPSRSQRTAVFGTSESQVIQRKQLADFRAYDQLKRRPPPMEVRAITPSRWSAEGFYRAGFRVEQVLVVPHGVDTSLFRPMPEIRPQIRSRLSIAHDHFVFLSVGTMTGNKGMGLLLRAFTEVSRRYPHARLVLKGMDPLYNSRDFLVKTLQAMRPEDQGRVVERLTYLGRSLSFRKMAQLYQIADCYVSPYKAEGFNMPVLEAAACGIPIICTGGGSTDDFVTDLFAAKIDAQKVVIRAEDQDHSQLEPNLEHLTALMSAAIENDDWRAQAAAAGPLHVNANYTWEKVVSSLVMQLST